MSGIPAFVDARDHRRPASSNPLTVAVPMPRVPAAIEQTPIRAQLLKVTSPDHHPAARHLDVVLNPCFRVNASRTSATPTRFILLASTLVAAPEPSSHRAIVCVRSAGEVVRCGTTLDGQCREHMTEVDSDQTSVGGLP
ncbi:hypothetical protein [Micromonospora haikouensis]|uniref:hypothetical protein n=1 Tax=Micromonospora haikouensis TaxID=686309 RepID=UPI0037B6B657